jgi:hypothetical protein
MEKTSDFVAKITSQFPNAELIKTTEPTPNIVNNREEGQYLLITAVNPSSEEEMNKQDCKPSKLPLYIRKYQSRNNVNIFVYSKPFRRGERIKDNDFSV